MNVKITFLMVLAMTAGMVMSCKKSEKPATPAATQPAAPAAPAAREPEASEETPQKIAPAFALMDQEGKEVKLADLAGKIVVLEWTNPECPYVKSRYASQAIPNLAKAYMEKGVVWLAINSTKDSDAAKNKTWHAAHKLTYPVLDDHAGKTGKDYHAKSTPHLFIIDAKGQIAYQGALDSDNSAGGKGAETATPYVKDVLEDLLAGKAPRHTQTQSYGCSVKYAD